MRDAIPRAAVVSDARAHLVEPDGFGGRRLADTTEVHDFLRAGRGVFGSVGAHEAWCRARLVDGQRIDRAGDVDARSPTSGYGIPACEKCGARTMACFYVCALFDAPLTEEDWR